MFEKDTITQPTIPTIWRKETYPHVLLCIGREEQNWNMDMSMLKERLHPETVLVRRECPDFPGQFATAEELLTADMVLFYDVTALYLATERLYDTVHALIPDKKAFLMGGKRGAQDILNAKEDDSFSHMEYQSRIYECIVRGYGPAGI